MKVFFKVFFFNVALIAFFLYVGNSIPQTRKDPPKDLELSADMSTEDFVKAGETIFYGKGTCALCHPLGEKGERCPDLAGVGERADQRVKEANYQGTAETGPEYLVESLHNPAVYVVETYQPSMPALGRQLNDLEMVALIAFLQAQGGEVTVDGKAQFAKYRGAGGAPAPAEVTMAERLCELIEGMDMVRMVNSGTEATMSAIRVARAANSPRREYIPSPVQSSCCCLS